MLFSSIDSSPYVVFIAVGVAILGAAWFGLRFWLASTRPSDIRDIHTPAIDRLNQQALERMGGAGERDEEDEEPPEELTKNVPGE